YKPAHWTRCCTTLKQQAALFKTVGDGPEAAEALFGTAGGCAEAGVALFRGSGHSENTHDNKSGRRAL
ncbi:MAG: hypothetical protein LBD24_04470, partial [Spirochaetaceae bacterium]|nr:hypothetical protein [Spirochaetaceae bacterium]